MRLYAKVCVEPHCRKGFTAAHHNACRCIDCRRERQKQQITEWKKKFRAYMLSYYRDYRLGKVRRGVPRGKQPLDGEIERHTLAINLFKR